MKSTRVKLYWFVVIFALLAFIGSTAPPVARGETMLKAPLSPTHSSRGLPQVAPARGCKWKGCLSLAQGWTGSEGFGGGNPGGKSVQSFREQSVNTLSGNFYHTFTDFSIAGRGLPLLFSRTYNAGAATQNGPPGWGWTDSYNLSLSIQQGSVTVNQENGSTVTFTLSGGVYTAPPRVLATLVQHQDGSFTFTRVQGQTYYTFNASGQLTQETDRDGYLTTLSYQGGHLSSVTDQAGRSLS
ncbi:MAG TPA: DUF6531 domain-containing protein, partial [Ktedonobacteraceae bacterium]|nr:DUF6531 domain-containing protein [Ktedonobacteraceae bacterium]